jgi:hypothetical protein
MQDAAHGRASAGPAYFREDAIALYLLLITEPRPFTAATMATEIPAAISPYSIEVAPASQRMNFINIAMISPRRFVGCANLVGKNCRMLNRGTKTLKVVPDSSLLI